MNTRFAVATHILTLLATQEGAPASSEFIASSVRTNPALIRRMLGQLARAGLTTSRMGAAGGSRLAREAAQISLLDVMKAVGDASLIALHDAEGAPCPVGCGIARALRGSLAATEEAIALELSKVSIADVLARLADESDAGDQKSQAMPLISQSP